MQQKLLITAATLILLTLSITCLAAGEKVQGSMFLAVAWVCSVLWRRDVDGKKSKKADY